MLTGTLYGESPSDFEIKQDGIRFLVSPLSGQKTGSFLDQRENRLAARAVAHGRALDCFTFAGAFALNLAGVCDSVVGLDISDDAVAIARRNAELNNAAMLSFVKRMSSTNCGKWKRGRTIRYDRARPAGLCEKPRQC